MSGGRWCKDRRVGFRFQERTGHPGVLFNEARIDIAGSKALFDKLPGLDSKQSSFGEPGNQVGAKLSFLERGEHHKRRGVSISARESLAKGQHRLAAGNRKLPVTNP